MRIVIIGNGVAATTAAATIRHYDTESSLTMLSDEGTPFYSRPRLIEYLAGTASFEKIVIRDSAWYEKNKITLLRDAKVDRVNPARHEVIGNFGTITYDALLIASGAAPALPAFFVPGLEGVFTLRTKSDADAIIAEAARVKSAIVIGGGLLGIETANALAGRGLVPTVVEYFDRLLPRQLDAEAAAILQSMLEAKGLRILLGKTTISIARESGEVAVRFADGSSLSAGMAIVSAGVRPTTAFLRKAGIVLGKGIIVDERMHTSAPDIFAAGDCAEFKGILYGIWTAAKEQGEVAGRAITGQTVEYRGSLMSARLKVAGIEVASMGDIALTANTRVESARDDSSFKKLFFENNRLKGAILIGVAVADQFKLQREMELPTPH